MLRIRLARVGKKKQPAYRLVVADARAPRDGRHVEIIGRYNPLTNPATLQVDEERARRWLQAGAQPSEAAAKLLAKRGLVRASVDAPQPPQPPKRGRRGAASSTAKAAPVAAEEAPAGATADTSSPEESGGMAPDQG